jgi:hypothetical protein
MILFQVEVEGNELCLQPNPFELEYAAIDAPPVAVPNAIQ